MNISLQKQWLALIGISFSSLTIGMDFTVVNVVLPNIGQQFSMSLKALQWVMTGFGIPFAALLITSGRIGDLLGRRLLLYLGIIGFGIASLVAGLSTSAWHLILARVLQGAFGATILPCGMAIVADAFRTNAQSRALAIYGSFLGIGVAAGPVIGGFITSISNWRWIFLINIPIILLSLTLIFFTVKESRLNLRPHIDWMGVLLVSTALSAFVLAVTESQVYGWSSPLIIISFIVSLLLATGFVFLEIHSTNPLFPIQLFLNRPFFIGVMLYIVSISFIWTVLFFLPLYLQKVLNFGVATTGWTLLPMTLMTAIAPLAASRLLIRCGVFFTVMLAFAAATLGLILFLCISTTFSFSLTLIAFVGIGLSWGIANGAALPLIFSHSSNHQHEGLVSGAASSILNIVGIVTLAVASTLFHFVEQQSLLSNAPSFAFMSGFYAVMWMLLILTLTSIGVVLIAFKKNKDNSPDELIAPCRAD